ncbi:MAG: hypothetical protein M0Q91_16285 [Methanoregula sp.]|nr:hypothetical protein [Methanoregula sp.]
METSTEWIHARIPLEMQGSFERLLERGYTKTELVKMGIRYACKQEGIKA